MPIGRQTYRFLRKVFERMPLTVIRFVESIKEKSLKRLYYSDSTSGFAVDTAEKTVIVMVDGRVLHGGLSDCLRGMVSAFKMSCDIGCRFKIHFNNPFRLCEYLEPNEIDWTIDENEISYNIDSVPIFIREYIPPRTEKRCRQFKSAIMHRSAVQYHVYTNIDCVKDDKFSETFNRLFKPSKLLEKNIIGHLHRLDGAYISVTFRFQQLLGDFVEGDFKTLDTDSREKLIEECVSEIENLYRNDVSPGKKILVTSDSVSFLQKADELPYVYVVPGKVVHIAYNHEVAEASYMKSFLDLFLISKAKKVYSVKIGDMYDSGFPRFAARIGDRPFRLISR